MMMMTTKSYYPTPLEQAYGHFLLQQVFGIPYQQQAQEIRVTGRAAVPFLTQSGLDRGLLRSIWTAADPNNVGTLTSTDQFDLILRLVAMAQSGALFMGHNVTADSLRLYVQQTSTQQLPLPTFSTVIIPPQEQLMSMFGPPTPTPLQQQQQQQQFPYQHQGGSMAVSMGPTTTTTTTTISIDEAFGSLVGEIQNAPLSGGGMMMQKQQHISHPSNMSALTDTSYIGGGGGGGGDFGDVRSGTSMQQPLPQQIQPHDQQHHRLMSSMGSVPDAFSTMSIGSGTSNIVNDNAVATRGVMMAPGSSSSSVVSVSSNTSNQQQQQMQMPTSQQHPLGCPPPQQMMMSPPTLQFGAEGTGLATHPTSNHNNDVVVDEDDDAFGGFASATRTATSFGATTPASGPLGASTFGMEPSTFVGQDHGLGSTMTTNNIVTTDISDAFSSLDAIVTDAPLPSLDAFVTTNAATSTTTATEIPSMGNIDIPPVTSAPDIEEVLEDDDGFTGFEEATPAPLDTSVFAVTTTSDDDDDDFGGFASATTTDTSSAVTTPAPGPFGASTFGVEPSTLVGQDLGFGSTMPTNNIGTTDISDAFSSLDAIVTDAPLPSLDAFVTTNTATSTTTATEISSMGNIDIPPVPAATDIENVSEDDDGFTGFEEAPSAPLDTAVFATTTTSNSYNEEKDDDDVDDEFGDFGTAWEPASMESNQPPALFGEGTQSKPVEDPFSLQQHQSQPLAPFMTDTGRAMSEPVVTTSSGYAFGGVAVTDTGRSLSVSDAFDAFGDMLPLQDNPLPSLNAFGGSGMAVAASVDDAAATSGDGTVKEVLNVTLPPDASNENGDNDDDDDDDFGGFSSAPALSSELPHNEVPEFLSFGSDASSVVAIPAIADLGRSMSEPFTSSGSPLPAVIADTGRSLSISDAFRDLSAGQEDVVLPSFDPFGGVTEPNTTVPLSLTEPPTGGDDEFGSFTSTNIKVAATPEDHFLPFETSLKPPAVTDLGRTHSEPIAGSGPAFPAVSHARSVSISDAFAGMPSIDTPLPSLDVLSETIATTEIARQGSGDGDDDAVVDDDDFGDFGGFVEAASSTDIAAATEANQYTASSFGPPDEPNFLAFDGASDSGAPGMTATDEIIAKQLPSFSPEFGAEASTLPPSGTVGDVGPNDTLLPSLGMVEGTGPIANAQDPGLNTNDPDFLGFGDETFQSVIEIGRTLSEPFPAVSQPPTVTGSTRSMSLATDVAFSSDLAPHSKDLSTWDTFATSEPSPQHEQDNDMEFGDFSTAGFDAPTQPVEPNIDASNSPPDTSFAAFDAPPPSMTDGKAVEADDDFGDFGGASPQSVEEAVNNYGMVVEQAQPNESAEAAQLVEDDDDDFGDFGNFQEVSPSADVETGSIEQRGQVDLFASGFDAPMQDQNNDDRFASTVVDVPGTVSSSLEENKSPPQEESTAKEIDPSDFDSFGDFASFEPVQNTAVTATETVDTNIMPTNLVSDFENADKDDDDDDWGDFEDVPSPSPVLSLSSSVNTVDTSPEEVKLRDRIRSLSLQLPESVLLKSGRSGDHADIGDAFETNIGIKSTMDTVSKRKVDRCIQVLELLSRGGDHSRLASTYWIQVFDVVNEELVLGRKLLNEARELPTNVWTSSGKNTTSHDAVVQTFTTFVAGLAEYMRVVRSIVATIGDILLLDESAMLTIDTWASSWCSLSILEKALEAEKNWKDIQKLLQSSSSSSSTTTPTDTASSFSWPLIAAPHAVTLQEIRSKVQSNSSLNNKVCQLTLQPLWEQHDRNTTRAEVTWQGRYFMACSANFLANRCPFFNVGGVNVHIEE